MATVAKTAEWDARDAAAMKAVLDAQRASFTAELPVTAATRRDRLNRALDVVLNNKDRFADFTEKAVADQGQLWLKHGEPMLFGSVKSGGIKGIALDTQNLALKVVDVVDDNWQAAGVLVHDKTNRSVAHMLVELPMGEGFPVALGVIYDDPKPTYEGAVLAQDAVARQGKSTDLAKLLAKGQTWNVAEDQGPLSGV